MKIRPGIVWLLVTLLLSGLVASPAVAGYLDFFGDPPGLLAIAHPADYRTNINVAVSITLAASGTGPFTYDYTTPAHGTLSGTAPTLFYTPASDYHGLDSFDYTVSDGGGTSLPVTINIAVNFLPVIDGPNNPPITTPEDTDRLITATDLMVTDTDNAYPGDFTLTVQPPAAGAKYTVTGNTITPELNYNGLLTVLLIVNDGIENSKPFPLDITVTSVNDEPVVGDIPDQTIAEGSTFSTINLDTYVTDVDNLASEMTWNYSGNTDLTVSITDRVATIGIPNQNWNGAEVITFTATDPGLLSASDTATFTVTAVNDPPVANAQSVSTEEDTALPITLTGSDVDGNTLTYVVVTDPAHGGLTGTAPNLTYTPAGNYHGPDSFTFKINDGTVDSAPAVISITVNAVNDPPVANAQSVITDEDTALPITLTGSDVDGNSLSYTLVIPPAHGGLSGTAPNLTYTPAGNFSGPDSFTFKVNDGSVDSAPALVSITVNAVNDPPVVGNIPNQTIAEGGTFTTITLDSYVTDVDNPVSGMVWSSSGNTDLTVTITNRVATIGIPNADWNGSETITFTAKDPSLASSSDAATFTVTAVNDPPILAGIGNKTINELAPLQFTASATDVESPPETLTFSLDAGAPTNASINPSTGAFSWTPTEAQGPGIYPITVRVTDNGTPSPASASETIQVTVNEVNAAPVLNSIGNQIAHRLLPLTFTATATDADIPANTLTFSLTGTPPSGASINSSTGVFSWTPTAAQGPANYSITVRVTDNGVPNLFTSETIQVNVLDQPPVAPLYTAPAISEGSSSTVQTSTLTGNASDPEGDPITFVNLVSGSAVNGTATIPSGGQKRVVFTPDANFAGTGSYRYTLSDTYTTVEGQVNIPVTNINSAPIGTPKTLTTLEDTALTILDTDFGFSDPLDAPPNTLLAVKITTLPSAGSLTVNSVPVTTGQFIGLADLQGGKLAYHPAANGNGSPYTTFTFQVQDNGTTAGGGVDLDPTPRLMTLNVTPVNDPPAGTDKTVTTLEDTAYNFTAADFGFTDPLDSPPNNFLAVMITSVPAAGTLSAGGSPVSAGTLIPAASLSGTYLSFLPAANASGTAVAAFTFQVQDDGGTAGGGVDLDPTPNTITFNVTAVNDPPVGQDHTGTMFENSIYTFGLADFPINDPLDTPPNALNGVVIKTIPSTGTLALNGTPVAAEQLILAANISAGNLKYTPVSNGNGAAYTSFTFQAQDNGGIANGGINLDPIARTYTMNVTPVNSPPSGADKTVATLEDTAYHFVVADFGFSDLLDSPPDSFLAVKITTLPGLGTLTLNSTAVTTGEYVPAADIAASKLAYLPALNGNGSPYTTFTFQVQDNGGIANGGVDLDSTPRTMTFNVTPVNDPPEGTDKTVTTLEDTAHNFTAADFGFTDPLDSPPNAFLAVKITTVPAAGTLSAGGSPVAAGTIIPAASLSGTYLSYLPALDASGTAIASFTFQVQDNGGGVLPDIDLDPTANTITFDVTPVNDPPVGMDHAATMYENGIYTFAVTDFPMTDLRDTPPDPLGAVLIRTLPSPGTLTLNSTPVAVDQLISAADITAGYLKYTPVPQGNGTPYAIFTFQVQDSGGIANGGINLDPVVRIYTINVTGVNSPPAGTDKTITILEDTPYPFAAADFGFSDPLDSPPNNFHAVKITTLPEPGTLTLNGTAVSIGQSVLVTDVQSSKLVFHPVANASGTPYTSFTFQVQDDGGILNGGVDLDPTPRTLTFNVTPVNDPPAGADITITTLEDTAHIFAAADFGFTDPLDSPSNILLAVKISSLPGPGTLTLNSAAVLLDQYVPAADIAAGKLTYQPALNGNGSPYTTFTFQVQDDGGTLNSGVDLDPTPRTITFSVTPVNDPPAGTPKTLIGQEDIPLTILDTDFGFTDPFDLPPNTLLAVKITTLPGLGSLTLDNVAVSTGQVIPVLDLQAAKLAYHSLANANGAPYTSFTFQVQDNGSEVLPAVNLDPTPRVMTINLTPVNDAPEGTDKTITTVEDTAHVFLPADFGFTDPLDTPPNTFLAVKITTLLVSGTSLVPGSLTLNGVPVSLGQFVLVSDILAGKLAYLPPLNGNGLASDNFTFQVRDNGGGILPNVDLDPTPNTITFNVTAVNDPPVAVTDSVTVLEDSGATIIPVLANDTDPEVPPETLKLISVGVAVKGTTFIPFGTNNVSYTPAANLNGPDSFTYTVQDNGVNPANLTAQGTVNVTITPVNDPPVGTPKTVTINENQGINDPGQKYVFSTADFGFSDPLDIPSNLPLAVKITTLPAKGSLNLGATTVTAGQFVAWTDIANLVYIPALHENGSNYGNFTFQVQDNGGGLAPNIDLDTTPRLFTINVNSLPDLVIGTPDTYYINKSKTFPFTVAAPGVLGNDIDYDGFADVTLLLTQNAAFGTVILNPNGSFTYTQSAVKDNYTDSFQYTLHDNSPVQDVVVTVTLIIDQTAPPVAQWVLPFPQQNAVYTGTSETIELEVFVDSIVDVNRVEFWYWDHVNTPNKYVYIAKDAFPTLVGNDYYFSSMLNLSTLPIGTNIQVFARTYDEAGNFTFQGLVGTTSYTARLFINHNPSKVFLPLIQR